MSNKMKSNEKILAVLKSRLVGYNRSVITLTIKRDKIEQNRKLSQDLADQTQDAINALEGAPTLKKTLEAAMEQLSAQKVAIKQVAPGIEIAPASANDTPEGLPPAELGFKWVQNEAKEWALVKIPGYAPSAFGAPVTDIVPPAVDKNDTFESPTLDI